MSFIIKLALISFALAQGIAFISCARVSEYVECEYHGVLELVIQRKFGIGRLITNEFNNKKFINIFLSKGNLNRWIRISQRV